MLPPFLLGPAVGAGIVVVAAAAGWGWLAWVHDPAVRAAYAAELEAVVAAQRAADQAAAIQAMQEVEQAAQARQAERTIIRERIIREPTTMACAAAPAVAAAVAGLRARGAGAGAAGDTRQPAGVRAGAAATGRPHR